MQTTGASSAVTAVAVRTGCLLAVLGLLRVSQSSGIFSGVVTNLIKPCPCKYSSSAFRLVWNKAICTGKTCTTESRAPSSFVFIVIDLLSNPGSEGPTIGAGIVPRWHFTLGTDLETSSRSLQFLRLVSQLGTRSDNKAMGLDCHPDWPSFPAPEPVSVYHFVFPSPSKSWSFV